MGKIEKQIYDKKYYQRNKVKRKKQVSLYQHNNPEKVVEKVIRWRWNNLRKCRIMEASWREKLKVEVLTHYGNGELQCCLCGEKRIDCLSIDHLNNDGYKRRGEGTGTKLYRLLKKQRYPTDYQTLCMNCQWVKKAEYQRERRLL